LCILKKNAEQRINEIQKYRKDFIEIELDLAIQLYRPNIDKCMHAILNI